MGRGREGGHGGRVCPLSGRLWLWGRQTDYEPVLGMGKVVGGMGRAGREREGREGEEELMGWERFGEGEEEGEDCLPFFSSVYAGFFFFFFFNLFI